MPSSHTAIGQRLRSSAPANALRRRIRGTASEPRWEGVADADQAAAALCGWAREATGGVPGRGLILTIGDQGALHSRVVAMLREQGHQVEPVDLDAISSWAPTEGTGVAAVLCTFADARRITDSATAVSQHPALEDVRFEYVSGLYDERSTFGRLDEYESTWFISPVLLDEPSPYEIYTESLTKFEQKCGLRDYLDLYQLLAQVVRNGVPGDIAEFGSFRGHSGYLIARSLEALHSDKRLFMFDTFESFPEEPYGVDQFWSATHDVDFESVRAKFATLHQVTMVKGDFTETLDDVDLDTVSLAFVDCDSYRATRYLIDALLPERIVPGGLLVFEDYGHPALLGNRVAVREGMRKYPGSFQFFSQFSGLYIVMKQV